MHNKTLLERLNKPTQNHAVDHNILKIKEQCINSQKKQNEMLVISRKKPHGKFIPAFHNQKPDD
ncbi:hypothetical protein AGMMS49936_06720 [Endomicrobiia bacterium]|nr:hypothetical protein AGMMS49936_06720 [Endomicrobiia bacterium]